MSRFKPLVFLLLFCTSCTDKRKLVFFQGEEQQAVQFKKYTPVLHPDDILSILVMDADMAAVTPFNLPVTNVNQNIGGYAQGAPLPPGYLIDGEGGVDFPVIGKIKLAGLTSSEAVDTLKKRLKPYLSHPTILLRIMNYKVTVLGEVRNPGTFTIPNERITLLEAIGIAGDLLITGVRKDVLVIRQVDGKKIEYRVDLTSKELFSSPVYFLSQNDVVYVAPNRAKMNSAAVNTANVSLVVSIVSLFLTMAVLFTQN